jgi:methionine salvage enolase-phosphatase E1
MEVLLLATIPVYEDDLAALATERANVVRAYILQSDQVEANRLFLTANQTGGVRSDGSRVFLQFQ